MLGRRSVVCVWLAWVAPHAVAQDAGRNAALGGACIQLNRSVVNQVTGGRLQEAETALSAALADTGNLAEQSCGWLSLYDMAVVMARSGQLAGAEAFAERALAILAKNRPPDDPVLLRPLQTLASVRYEQGKMARAREAFQKMESIRLERPEDRALVHGTAAALLQAEGRNSEAETEYLKTLAAWDESGRGESADGASVLSGLGGLYIAEGRFKDAGRTLDRALAVLDASADTVPTDRIKALNTRAVLRVRLGKWAEAEQDLRSAVSTAERDARMDPAQLASLLANYAYVLRKIHRGKQARAVESRAAEIRARAPANEVVDVTELLAKK
jgi:tetratricopeptide (TPR) repeat protein